MESSIIIPSRVQKLWEEQAMRENLTRDEFLDFIKDQERKYLESLQPECEGEEIFANSSRNKLTEYGNEKVLKYFLAIPQIERICKFARFDFEDFYKKYQSIKEGKSTNKDFFYFLDLWYKKLKDDMKEYRISKETFLRYGFNYKEATNFYFACKQEFETK